MNLCGHISTLNPWTFNQSRFNFTPGCWSRVVSKALVSSRLDTMGTTMLISPSGKLTCLWKKSRNFNGPCSVANCNKLPKGKCYVPFYAPPTVHGDVSNSNTRSPHVRHLLHQPLHLRCGKRWKTRMKFMWEIFEDQQQMIYRSSMDNL